jgi:hypothetical protein
VKRDFLGGRRIAMIVTNYTPEDLKKLPLRAIVALSVRCARRVEHLALLPDGDPDTKRLQAAVANTIRLAEDFAKGLPCSSFESVVREVEACRAIATGDFVRESAMGAIAHAGHATAAALNALELRNEPGESSLTGHPPLNPFPKLADITADLSAREVFTAALEAVAAIGHSDHFIKGAVEDYEKLLRLDLGRYPEAGKPIDPSPRGPLGPQEPPQ